VLHPVPLFLLLCGLYQDFVCLDLPKACLQYCHMFSFCMTFFLPISHLDRGLPLRYFLFRSMFTAFYEILFSFLLKNCVNAIVLGCLFGYFEGVYFYILIFLFHIIVFVVYSHVCIVVSLHLPVCISAAPSGWISIKFDIENFYESLLRKPKFG